MAATGEPGNDQIPKIAPLYFRSESNTWFGIHRSVSLRSSCALLKPAFALIVSGVGFARHCDTIRSAFMKSAAVILLFMASSDFFARVFKQPSEVNLASLK